MTTRRQWRSHGLRRPPPGPRRLSWRMAERLHREPLGVSGDELMAAIRCLRTIDGDLIQSHWLQARNVEAGRTNTHMSRADFAHFGGSSAVCGALVGNRASWTFYAQSEAPTCVECAKRWAEAMAAREVIIAKQVAEIQKRYPKWTPRGGLGPHREEIRLELKALRP